MAQERIVSPGVFTEEKDLSFLPQGIAEIGGAIIGPFEKGPAFVPTIVNSQNEARIIFGSSTFYTPYAVQNYLKSAGQVTIVRVLGSEGFSGDYLPIKDADDGTILAILGQTRINPDFVFDDGTNGVSFTAGNSGSDGFVISISGSNFSASFDSTKTNYLPDLLGTSPLGTKGVFVWKNFPAAQSESVNKGAPDDVETGSIQSDNTFGEYSHAETPFVRSQLIAGDTYDLFKFATRGDGNASNQDIKVGITAIRFPSEVVGSDYGTFSVVVREYDDSDRRPQILETFANCTLDPTSPNYLPRLIGDQYQTFETVDGSTKRVFRGDWPNISEYIRVTMSADIDDIPKGTVPFGYNEYLQPLAGALGFPSMSQKTAQLINDVSSSNAYFGVGFDETNTNVGQYLNYYENNTTILSASDFQLDNYVSGSSTSILSSELSERKFILGFQGGFDGKDPRVVKAKGGSITNTNTQGFDLSTTAASGTVDYKKAINTVSNPDEFDINLLVLPGVIHRLHPLVTNHGIDVCEDRGDCFYIMDSTALGDSVTQAVNSIQTLDTNYAATYYPWVKIIDPNTNLPIWVPPSVVMTGVYAFNDQVADEWFAPAGLNRGGITEAVQAYTRLTHTERDTLYEGRVNPIASFPGEGVVAWGQKTLQVEASALDRVNVRRLLIAVKKFIASSSRFLVFEQNVAATRNRFLNIVNPFLESVQQRSGLFAFRVIMDETNNTPEIIDRNQLFGQIFLKPTRTAEFILLDFNILPTGAEFPEG